MNDYNNENNKTVWIFHHYATPLNMSGMGRPSYFAEELKKQGYKVNVFASSYLHYSNENLINDGTPYITINEIDTPFIFIKTSSYQDNGMKRVINMFEYYRNVKKVSLKLAKESGKPDYILATSPHPLSLVAGINVARKLNVPIINEVRDFWPEVFFLGGKLKEKSLIGKLLVRGERCIYEKSDALVFLKEGDSTYITDKKWDVAQGGKIDMNKCYYINNGVNLKEFKANMQQVKLIDDDLDSDMFNVVYAGAVRPINNVGSILDAAKLLSGTKGIQFLIYGDGNELEHLNNRIIDENITNVVTKGYVEKRYIPYILSKSSLNILNYSQTKYNWSRGNSSNKLFEYMASGKPVISTVKMGYSIIDKYQFGIELNNSTPQDMAEAILKIYNMPRDEYNQLGVNALKGASDFDYSNLTKKLVEVFNSVSEK